MTKLLWMFLPPIFAMVLANLTILHALSLHKTQLFRLWVLAPNQFIYPLLVFPFASLCCFLAFYGYFWRIPESFQGTSVELPAGISKVLIENPALPILLALTMSILAVFFVYEKGQWTFDKLKPHHAIRALEAMDNIDIQLDGYAKKDERDAFREKSIREARKTLDALKRNTTTSMSEVDKADDWVFLQIVRDSDLPQRLGLFDRGMLVLNVVQMLTILFVFSLVVVLVGLCYFGGDQIAALGKESSIWLHKSAESALLALILAALFALFYLLLNRNIEPFVGRGAVTLFNYFVPFACVACAYVLWRYGLQYKSLDSVNWWELTKSVVPLISALLGLGAVAFFMEKFFGRDAGSLNQLLGSVLLVALGVISVKETVVDFLRHIK